MKLSVIRGVKMSADKKQQLKDKIKKKQVEQHMNENLNLKADERKDLSNMSQLADSGGKRSSPMKKRAINKRYPSRPYGTIDNQNDGGVLQNNFVSISNENSMIEMKRVLSRAEQFEHQGS